MAVEEHSLLHCLDLEVPVQIDTSIEQDYLLHEKEIIYPAVVNVIYEHEESQQNRSHKKREDSLETRAVLLVFLLELEISGVAVQSIHQNS